MTIIQSNNVMESSDGARSIAIVIAIRSQWRIIVIERHCNRAPS
jgi:hypothetical protein